MSWKVLEDIVLVANEMMIESVGMTEDVVILGEEEL